MVLNDSIPWHAKPLRLAQINLNELDPLRLDVEQWISYLSQSKVDVLSFNVGGAVAFYPSTLHGHNITPFLGSRDPIEELTSAAREKGMKVLARLDFNRTKDVLYYEHPDWFTIDHNGKPVMHYGFYDACPSGPYYSEFMPSVIREIMERYRFEGIFAVNCHYTSFTIAVCHCVHCKLSFREAEGAPIPDRPEWDNPLWHRYLRWRYRMTTNIWTSLKQVTRETNEDAVFLGNLGGGISRNTPHGWELSEIARLEDAVQQETQNRGAGEPVFLPAEQGKLMRSIAHGKQVWLMMSYNFGFGARFQASPPAELQVWFAEAFAAGGLPYVHFIGGHMQDTRSLDTIRDMLVWHAENEQHLSGDSAAEVAVVYSLRTVDHYGKDQSPQRYDSHFRGYYKALLHSHIPFDVLHEAALAETDLSRYKVLVLPNAVCLPEVALQAIRGFVDNGGGLVATHKTSLFDEWGVPQDNFSLSDLFGARYNGRIVTDLFHSHMRIKGDHPITQGLKGTEMLPNAGSACSVQISENACMPLVLVPPCPTYPPELAWTRIEETSQAMAVTNVAGGRVVYFPGTLDQLYWENNLPDHALVLADAVRWAGKPIEVGLPEWEPVDVHLYRMEDRIVLHLVNLTGAERGPLYKLYPIHQLHVSLKLPADIHAVEALALVDSGILPLERDGDGDTVKLVVPMLRHYEVLVFQNKE